MTATQFGDSPDFQNLVNSPQVLLAQVNAGNSSVVVQVPANAESIVVVLNRNEGVYPIYAVGGTSNGLYPPVRMGTALAGTIGSTWVIPAFPSVDESLTIELSSASTYPWFVMSDGGVRGVIDTD